MACFRVYIYRSPLGTICVFMILAILFWVSVGYMCARDSKRRHWWKNINILCLIVETMLILHTTVLTRQSIGREVILIPFYSFYEAIEQPEYYRSMLMNVFLFFPLGLSMPLALPDVWRRKVFISIMSAIGCSLGIECIQYIFCLGRAEIDDVICNTLGCAIGTGAYLISQKLKSKNKNF